MSDKKSKIDLENLIDVRYLTNVETSKIFKKAFLNKLEGLNSTSFGIMFTTNDSIVMLAHNTSDDQWIYMAIPSLDERTRNKLFRYLKVKEEVDKDGE